ncbi:hypothetical protein Tco_0405570, partial [Tanacetum coccineum]
DAPFLIVFDDDEGFPDVIELKDANACHLKISPITHPAWKNHLDNHIDLDLLDLHDRCYARQAVVDNAVNRRSPELMMMLESQKWAGYQHSLSTLESKEVEELKQDRREVVSKVIPYAAMELVHSDDMGSLVGRCRAFEQVAGMKEPFDLLKVKGYCSSYKKDHTQDSNDLATATFPWLDEFVADPSAPIEALLSKKPLTLQRLAPSRTQFPLVSSQRATSSSIPASNPMPLYEQRMSTFDVGFEWRISCANPKGRFPWGTESLIMFEESEDF